MSREPKIHISFCFIGRNDNYSPDFLYRMSTTLNFLAYAGRCIDRLDAIEIIVVDWGSDKPLRSSLSLTDDACLISRFYEVPESICSQYPQGKLPGNICFNIGLRRARGQLVTCSGAEILVPPASLASLIAIIEGRSDLRGYQQMLFVCGRYRLPAEWVLSQPSVEQWQEYLQMNSWRINQEPARGGFLTGNAGLFLIPRQLLHESRGLLEALDPNWGWNDVEYTMRLTSKFPCLDLNSSGVQIYDMEHLSFTGERESIVKQQAQRLLCENLAANDKNWGAGQCDINAQRADPIGNDFRASELYVQACVIDVNQLRDFAIWLAVYVEELPSIEEWKLLWLLYQLMKGRNFLYYSELGLNQGKTFYLAAKLAPQAALTGIDRWKKGGGENGPEHIAWNLTTPSILHVGALRLNNMSLHLSEEQILESLAIQQDKQGIIFLRLNTTVMNALSLENAIDKLLRLATTNILIFYGDEAKSLSSKVVSGLVSCELYQPYDALCVISRQPLCLKDFERKLLLELQRLANDSVDLRFLSQGQCYSKIVELKKSPLILIGKPVQIALFWPHFCDQVLGVIIDNGLQELSAEDKSMLSNIPEDKWIDFDQLGDFLNAQLVRL